MSSPATSDPLLARADGLAARGDLAGARAVLEEGFATGASSFEVAMRLASLRRATRDGAGALAAVSVALAASPLDFVALLLRARLLEDAGDGEAGEAYRNALSQRPAEVPPALRAMVDRAKAHAAAHEARQAERLERATAPVAAGGDADQQQRYARFRSNVLRRTAVFHSEPTHYHFPGLVEREFHPRARFPWLAALEAATDAIAADLARVMAAERAELVPYVQYAADLPMRQWADLNHSRDWTAIHLVQRGDVVAANARHCPATMAAIAALPQPQVPGRGPNAMFSLLAPGTRIPPHTGVANTRLVCHLPLIVPSGCWFRVGAETREWRRGEAFVFDDTIEHEAANGSDQLRVVLIVDVWHPDLDERDRQVVAALMQAERGLPVDGL